jgi:hypothetical protein
MVEDTAEGATRDAVFLIAVVLLSSLLYLPGLRLYSDDWALLAMMRFSPDSSLLGLYEALLPSGISTRPLQGLLLAGLYWLFAMQPFGYHAANTLVLCATVILLYLALRGLGLPRFIAVAVPLVYGLLPHFSTARFWIAAYQANLSVAFYALSLYADVRFARAVGREGWPWKLLGAAALVASVLSYEITAALFLVNPFLLWYAARVHAIRSARDAGTLLALLLSVNSLALLATVAFKAGTTQRTAFMEGLAWRIIHTAREATAVHFGSYGAALPLKVVQSIQNHFDLPILLASLLVGVVIWVYVRRVFARAGTTFPERGLWLRLLLAGGVVFAAGYGVALLTWEIGFDTTGMNNRTAGGAALGTALVFVATVGLVSTLFRTMAARWLAFSAILALLGGSGCLLVNTTARFWIDAAHEQQIIMAGLVAQVPSPAPGTAVLIDGICPYIGPGVVFETGWDVTGRLRVLYDDTSLQGDVVKANTVVSDDGVRTTLYDDVINLYPYNDRLIVFDHERQATLVLTDIDVARDYFADHAARYSARCPDGTEGYGVRIF